MAEEIVFRKRLWVSERVCHYATIPKDARFEFQRRIRTSFGKAESRSGQLLENPLMGRATKPAWASIIWGSRYSSKKNNACFQANIVISYSIRTLSGGNIVLVPKSKISKYL
ncbi:MAG: hypothetical protein QW179_04745 [Candidatus Hadarchaeales archaeon]